jgi:hypothetical protein
VPPRRARGFALRPRATARPRPARSPSRT